MAHRVKVAPLAERVIRRLDPHIRKRVNSDLMRLADDPRPHGIEKLITHDKLYRIAVGPGKDYRAIYEIHDEVLLVLVVKVGNRKEVYRRVQ